MAWIKLSIHPEHDKVLTLADLTGVEPEKVFAAVVRWFFWVDQHAEDETISISRQAFRRVTRWEDDTLAQGMLSESVDWLCEDENGKLGPTRFDRYMSEGAKKRAKDQERKAASRSCPQSVRKKTDNSRTERGQNAEPEKELELERDREEEKNIVVDEMSLRLMTEETPTNAKRGGPFAAEDAKSILRMMGASRETVETAIRNADAKAASKDGLTSWRGYVRTQIANGCTLVPSLALQDTQATRNRDHVIRMLQWALNENLGHQAERVQAWFNALSIEDKARCLSADHRDGGGSDHRRWQILCARAGIREEISA